MSDRPIALVDQGLLAVARFAAMLVFGRIFPADVFGTLALAVTLSYISVGFNRSLVVLPFVFDSCSEEKTKSNGPVWLAGTLIVALVLIALLVTLGLALKGSDRWGWIGSAFLWSAVLCPLANIYEFIRRWIIQKRDAKTSILQVVTFNGFTFALLAICYITKSELMAIMSLAIPYALGSVASLKSLGKDLRLDFAGAIEGWRHHRSLCSWGLAEYLADICVGYGLIALVSTSLGSIGSAVYAATRNVVAPIYAIVSALVTVEPPRFARSLAASGISGLRVAFRSALILHVALVGFTASIAYAFGDIALHWAYNSKFDDHGVELKIWIIAACLSALSKPFESWLLALGHARILFRCKAAGAIVAIATSMLLLNGFGLPGILAGMVAGLAVNCVLLVVCRLRITDVLKQS